MASERNSPVAFRSLASTPRKARILLGLEHHDVAACTPSPPSRIGVRRRSGGGGGKVKGPDGTRFLSGGGGSGGGATFRMMAGAGSVFHS
ncbi:unnamed protein product, partial [Ectocarpus sp. 12 AP-2014]